MTTALVGLGGLIGVLGRYGVTRLTLHTDALLWSTVGINVVGSFLLGVLAAEHWFSRDVREAIGVGLLGGFTTFSSFSVESLVMLQRGQFLLALGHTLAHVMGALACAAVGFRLAQAVLLR